MRSSSSIATSRSLRPTTPASSVSRNASSASRDAARMRSISPASLTARSPSTSPAQGDELPSLAEQLAQARVLLDGEARVVEPQAHLLTSRRGERLDHAL